jgi:hypothetical protein
LKNGITALLGITIIFLSALSVFLINNGVIPSREYPGHYTYSSSAHLVRYYLFPLMLFTGLLAVGHGWYKKRISELMIGIAIELWGANAFWFIALTLIDGGSPYIKGPIGDILILMSLTLAVGLAIGIALTLDGIVDIQGKLTVNLAKK